MVLPDWLTTAKSETTPAVYPWREVGDFLEIMAGDVVLVGDMDRSGESRRLVAVLDVDTDRRFFLGALVTNELSLATADDLILEPVLTGLPYPVAVLARLAGYMWSVQIDERLGALTDEALAAAIAGYGGGEDDLQRACRGVPLQDQGSDLRWSHLEVEAERIHELSEDCTQKRHKDGIALPFVDPSLWPVSGDGWDESCAEILAALEEDTRNGRTRGLSPSCVEQLITTVDMRYLRAYPALFSPTSHPASSLPAGRNGDNAEGLFRELTISDGLTDVPFVKVVTSDTSWARERFVHDGRRAVLLPEMV